MRRIFASRVVPLAVIACMGLLLNGAAQRAAAFNPFDPTAKPAPAASAATEFVALAPVTISPPLPAQTTIGPGTIGISIADAVTLENGVAAPTPLKFLVALTQASKSTVTVTYTTSNVDTPGFKPTTGTLTFTKGMTSQYLTISVPQLGVTATDLVLVTLSDASGAKIVNGVAFGTIISTVVAPPPTVSVIGDVVTPSAPNVWVRVQLSTKAHPQTVKVTFNTQPVAKMIKDYSGPASTVLTFDPGVDQQFVEIQLLGKVKPVGTEKVVIFTDSLSDPVNCTIDVGAANCSVMQ